MQKNQILPKMKIRNLLIFICALITNTLNANVITVDNNIPGMGDYISIQAAHDAANSGDTILVFPSAVHYQAITLTKKLIIIGAGSEIINKIKITYLSGNLVFEPESSGSVVSSFGSVNGTLSVEINASNVELKRIHLKNIVIYPGNSDIAITGCLIRCTDGDGAPELILVQQAGNILISNSIIRGSSNRVGIKAVGSNLTIFNNIIHSGGFYVWDEHSVFYQNSSVIATNNIFAYGKMLEGEPCPYNYNICCNPGLGGISCGLWCGIGNISNLYDGSIFFDYNGGNYKLKPGSPAIGSGENGTDMGIYGGDMPYVDGGYPDLPTIYHLNVPLTGTTQNGVNITIKAKSNN